MYIKAEKNWQGLALISLNEHKYSTTLLQLDEIELEEWKEGNFLPVVCGTESSAVLPVLSFSSDTRGKSNVSDGNDTRAAHTGGYIWSVMEEDWADVKDGRLGNEWLVSRYISPTSLHHQSSFTILFLGLSVFFSACLLFLCVHLYFLTCPFTTQIKTELEVCGCRGYAKH